MLSPKDDVRYSSERQLERYHEDRVNYYREREIRDERDSGASGNGNIARHSQEADPDRGNKKVFFLTCVTWILTLFSIVLLIIKLNS